MQKNKPSIYQDRGTIGSAKELDEYGVWVKSEPQILEPGGAEPGSDLSLDELPDFSVDSDVSSGLGTTDFSIPEDDFNLDGFDTGTEGDGTDQAGAAEGDLPGFPGEHGMPFSIDEDESAELGGEPDFSLDEDAFSLDEDALPSGEDALDGEEPSLELPALEEPAGEKDDNEGFVDISLEDLLGQAEDKASAEQSHDRDGGRPAGEIDMSTQLLMKIAGELSSIRQELSALKQEFSMSRGGLEVESGESRGFFDNAGGDDKIALTGDELNNIISTADFTEETGADAGSPDGEDGPEPLGDGSAGAELPAVDLSFEEDPLPEIPDDLMDVQPLTEDRDQVEEGLSLVEEAGNAGLSPADLSMGFSLDASEDVLSEDVLSEDGPAESAGEELELPEISLDDAEDLLALNPETITDEDAESAFPDISLDFAPDAVPEEFPNEAPNEARGDVQDEIPDETPVEEALDLGDFEDGALDLSDAVIDEPDLGARIQENPPLEPVPSDVAVFEEPPEEPLIEEAAIEIEDETEIARPEESAAEIPAMGTGGSRGVEQIIPEGFLVEELDDEGEAGFGGAGLDTLDEGVSLDEIPEDLPPEEEVLAEDAAEPDIAGLPGNFRKELKQVLSYMDQLLESLPEEKIEEFAQSEYFDTYKKLFKDLGLT
ncbi:MAG: hypothetical protein LBF95_09205 [Treponema sp.]|jgi:hypothetical protein|nr:hypothetical protein [Treponema sp.]